MRQNRMVNRENRHYKIIGQNYLIKSIVILESVLLRSISIGLFIRYE